MIIFKKNSKKWFWVILLAFSVVILGTSIEYYSIDTKAYDSGVARSVQWVL